MRLMSRQDNLGIIVLLAAVVFLVYGNALFNQFIWDDGYLIVANPYIKDVKFIPHLFSGDLVDSTAAGEAASGYYRPLSMLWFLFDYQLWKLNAFGWHLTNVLIHLANSIFVFFILLKISPNRTLSLLTALFFAVHPVHVEAVVPVYNRMGLQAALSLLAAFLSFLSMENSRRTGWLAAGLIFLLLGLFSKEDVIILPLVFLGYDFVCLSDFKVRNLFSPPKVFFYSGCILVCVIYLLIRHANVHYRFLGSVSPELLGVAWAKNSFYHILTVVKMIGLYLSKAIWPFPLSPVYWSEPVNHFWEWESLMSLLAVLVLLGWAYYRREKEKMSAFFILFFFISILPVSNILPIAEVYTFRERFLYIPSLSVCFFLARGCLWLVKKSENVGNFQFMRYLIPGIPLVITGVFTASSNYIWRNNLSLWRYAVESDPLSQLAHLNLGETYLTMGRIPEAIEEFSQSLRTPRPQALSSVYLAKLNLATVYIDRGDHTKASQELEEALAIAGRIKLNPASAYDKLGLLSAKRGDQTKAEENFKQALAHNPQFLTTRYNLAVFYFSKGQYQRAEEQLHYARQDKDFLEAAYLWGLTLLAQNKKKEAEAMFEHILRKNPGHVLAQQQLKSFQER